MFRLLMFSSLPHLGGLDLLPFQVLMLLKKYAGDLFGLSETLIFRSGNYVVENVSVVVRLAVPKDTYPLNTPTYVYSLA